MINASYFIPKTLELGYFSERELDYLLTNLLFNYLVSRNTWKKNLMIQYEISLMIKSVRQDSNVPHLLTRTAIAVPWIINRSVGSDFKSIYPQFYYRIRIHIGCRILIFPYFFQKVFTYIQNYKTTSNK